MRHELADEQHVVLEKPSDYRESDQEVNYHSFSFLCWSAYEFKVRSRKTLSCLVSAACRRFGKVKLFVQAF